MNVRLVIGYLSWNPSRWSSIRYDVCGSKCMLLNASVPPLKVGQQYVFIFAFNSQGKITEVIEFLDSDYTKKVLAPPKL